jgi:hypothetical protein
MYLVGNGYSLRNTNLDILRGKPSMGVNKIHLIYGHTTWRPTHYLKVDYSPFDNDNWMDEVMPHVDSGEQCLLWHAFHGGLTAVSEQFEIKGGVGNVPNVEYIGRCHHHDEGTGDWHSVCTGLNSVLTMAIWAVELGAKEIVLVGFDGKYTTPDKDHFVDNYYKTWDSAYADRNNTNIVKAHRVIHAFCPVPVYDATVDGSLVCYPKVALEEVVNSDLINMGVDVEAG